VPFRKEEVRPSLRDGELSAESEPTPMASATGEDTASATPPLLARLAAIPLTIIDALAWSLLSLVLWPFFAVGPRTHHMYAVSHSFASLGHLMVALA